MTQQQTRKNKIQKEAKKIAADIATLQSWIGTATQNLVAATDCTHPGWGTVGELERMRHDLAEVAAYAAGNGDEEAADMIAKL